MKYIIICLFLITTKLVYALETFEVCQDPSQWDNPYIIHTLEKEKINSIAPMHEHLEFQGKLVNFKGELYVVTFDNGFAGVFKPFLKNNFENAIGEVIAYNISLFLKFPLVPPTTTRTINGRPGTIQLFIHSNIDPTIQENYKKLLPQVKSDDKTNLEIFYFIFGKWNNGPENIILKNTGKHVFIIPIDNSDIIDLQYVTYGDFPFVEVFHDESLNTNDLNTKFPFNQARTIDKLSIEDLKIIFQGNDNLAEKLYNSLKIKEPFRYVIYQNSVWVQYNALNKNFAKPNIVNYCPVQTIEKLKSLNKEVIKQIFSIAKNSKFFTEKYIQDILNRRDIVLQHCLNNKIN